MFSDPFTTRQRVPKIRLMALGCPQFVALGVGLLMVRVVVAFILYPDISESLYRLDVRQ